MRATVLLVFFFICTQGFTQKDSLSLSLGYFAPYGVQWGAKVGLSMKLKSWSSDAEKETSKVHALNLRPQIAFFSFSDVQRNFLISSELLYQRIFPFKKLVPVASIGLGYLLARQDQDGTVDLGSGEITKNTQSIHYFTPLLNLGFDILPKNKIGYYFRMFYGRKISFQNPDAALFGLELGTTLKINRKKSF